MNISEEELNSFIPYQITNYEYYQGRIHPASYSFIVNTNAINKARYYDGDTEVLLNANIDPLFPILEKRYLFGGNIIFELSRTEFKPPTRWEGDTVPDRESGKKIFVVSSSPYLIHALTNETIHANKDNIRVGIQFFFYEDDNYKLYEPTMPNYMDRLKMFLQIRMMGYEVIPILNPEPEFEDEMEKVLSGFEREAINDFDRDIISEYAYLVTDEKKDFWKKCGQSDFNKQMKDLF